MKTLFTLIISVASLLLYAQAVDEDRMQKDIEVTENILATLIKQSQQGRFIHSDRFIEGNYVKDFGVIFRVNNQHMGWGLFTGEENKVIIWNSDQGKGIGASESSEDFKDEIKNFLADYGNLIKQLSADEKILVKVGAGDHRNRKLQAKIAGGDYQAAELSIEVSKSDLNEFDERNISRDELLDRITVKESEVDYGEQPQLEVFTAILDRLYDDDLSETYYLANEPSYEKVSDFGVTFYLKFYSSYIHDNDTYSIPTINKKNISKKDRDQIVDDMYPEFLDGFKENLLEYGHALKNLDANEMIIFDMKMTSCDPCDMPARIEVSLNKSVIDDYRERKLTLNEAMTKIQVKEINL